MKDRMLEIAEGIIHDFDLPDDMDTFYAIEDFIMENWEGPNTSITELGNLFIKKHPEMAH